MRQRFGKAAADERETWAEFMESVDDAIDQSRLQFPLDRVTVDSEKVERVRIASDLLREFGIWLFARERRHSHLGQGSSYTVTVAVTADSDWMPG